MIIRTEAFWAFIGALLGGGISAFVTYKIGIRSIKVEMSKLDSANRNAEIENKFAINKEKGLFLTLKTEKLEKALKILLEETNEGIEYKLDQSYKMLEQNIHYFGEIDFDKIKKYYLELCYICSDENIRNIENGKQGTLPNEESFAYDVAKFLEKIKNIFSKEIQDTIKQQNTLYK